MLPANTLILVNPYGVRKLIQDLKVGDQIVTHARQQRPITFIHTGEMKEGSLINIEVKGYTQHIQLSEKQQVLTYPRLRLLNGKPETEIVGTVADRSFDVAWKYAKDLEIDDYIQLPTPYIRNSIQPNLIKGVELPGVGQGIAVRPTFITTRPYRGKTYSLTVEEDNSFVARGYMLRT